MSNETPTPGLFDHMVLGENESAFRRVEFIVNQLRINGGVQNLALVGVPSAGKTTTALLISKALGRPAYEGGGENLQGNPFDALLDILEQTHGVFPAWIDRMEMEVERQVQVVKPCLVFLDEAHRIPKPVEALMLQALEKPYRVNIRGIHVDFSQVMWVLGTTDFSMLAQPFQTRFFPIPFVGYSVDSVAAMVLKHFPYFTPEDATRIARAGKGFPRSALKLATLLASTPETQGSISTTLTNLFGIDEQGLDQIDQRILEILRGHRPAPNLRKKAESEAILAMPNSKGISAVRAQAYLDSLEHHAPMAQGALADKLQYTDTDDLFRRIVYLETLGLVKRARAGVLAT